MKNKMIGILAVLSVIAIPSVGAAYAASDDPTPFTVTDAGVYLPDGVTFSDGGHVNVKSNQGDRGIHFESLNNQPSGQWIGKNFIPWSAFGYDVRTLCVSWVQLSQYSPHFGEGHQAPIGQGCTTPSASSPTVTPSISPSATPSPTITVSPSPSATPTETPAPSPTTSQPSSTPSTTPTPVPTSTSVLISSAPSTTPTSSLTTESELAATGMDWWGVFLWVVCSFVFLTLGTFFIMVPIAATKQNRKGNNS